jgi:hypothetical protein
MKMPAPARRSRESAALAANGCRRDLGLESVTKDVDRIKPIGTLLAHSLSSYRVTKASIANLDQTELPFVFDYSLVADNYAKPAGKRLLVRPPEAYGTREREELAC